MPENPLIGNWRLVSCVAIRDHGARLPIYGKRPIGRLHYDSAGNMSVHIMRAGSPVPGGVQAYFSTYAVDTDAQIIRHEVLGSLDPDWIGTTQVRYYEMQGHNRLVLRSAPLGSPPVDEPIFELVWERITEETTDPVSAKSRVAHR